MQQKVYDTLKTVFCAVKYCGTGNLQEVKGYIKHLRKWKLISTNVVFNNDIFKVMEIFILETKFLNHSR